MNSGMFLLLVVIISGIGISVFGMQNPQTVMLNFGPYHLEEIPLYQVVLGSLLFGLLMGWIINLVNSFFTTIKIQGKNSKIKHAEKNNSELAKKLERLELENESLKEVQSEDDPLI